MLFPRPSHPRRVASLLLLCWLTCFSPAFADNQAPIVSGSFPGVTVLEGAEEETFDLSKTFSDPDVTGSVVRLSMVYSTASAAVSATNNIDIALFDKETPITVANFLDYVNSELYNNTFIHRAPAGFVVQGGGFTVTGTNDVTAANIHAIPKRFPIANEYSATRSNLRGTIAMAKLALTDDFGNPIPGGGPDSATNEWFISLGDNSGNLDNQNGGFTVFGRVLGNGMDSADEIDQLPKFDYSSDIGFKDWPLGGRTAGTTSSNPIRQSQLVRVESAKVIPALTFEAVSDDTDVVLPTVSPEGVLSLSYTGTGSATVTVTAHDLDGASVTKTFAVNVQPQTSNLVAFESASVTANEGGNATLRVVRTGTDKRAFTVHYATYNLTGTAGINYTAVSNSLPFALNETVKTITIPVASVSGFQTGKSFGVALSSPSPATVRVGTQATATVNISESTPNPNGVLQFSSSAYGATAGAPVMVQVTRTGGSTGQVTAVVTTSDLTALNGTDYTGLTQRVTFPSGDTSPKTVVIPTLTGTNSTGFKHFTVTLLQPTGGATLGADSITDISIASNFSSAGTFVFALSEFRVSGSGTNAIIAVQRLGGSGTTSRVAFSTGTSGSAIKGTHFVATSGTLIFGVNESVKTFPVSILPVTESVDRTVDLKLAVVSPNALIGDYNKTATLVIARSASTAVISFQSANYLLEAGTTGNVTLTRTGSTTLGASAYIEFEDQSGRLGTDYSVSGAVDHLLKVDFAPGSSTAIASFTTGPNPDKTFAIRLVSASSGNAVGANHSVAVTIAGALELSRATYQVSEASGKVMITVVRSGTATLSVDLSTSNNTAIAGIDFAAVSQTLNFGVGVNSKTVEIPILPTSNPGNRTFKVTLSNPVGGSLGVNSEATVSIIKTASGGTFSFSSSSYRFDADNQYKSVTVLRTGTARTVYVQFTDEVGRVLTDGTLNNRVLAVNFATGATSASFNIGEVNGKGDDTVKLALVDASGGIIGTPSIATVSFIDPEREGALIEFSPSTYRVTKSIGSVRMTVMRTGTTGITSVRYATANGTAVSGSNYTATSGTLTFPAGVTTQIVNVPIIPTAVTGGTVTLNLSNPTNNAVLGEFATATVAIVNDASATAGVYKFGQPSDSFDADGTPPNVTVVRSRTGVAATIYIRAINGSATLSSSQGVNQYVLAGDQNSVVAVNFAAAESSKTVSVGATSVDGLKNLSLELVEAPAAGAIGNPALATVQFFNGYLEFTPTAYRVKQSNGKAVLVITRKNGLGAAKVIWNTLSSGSTGAVANTDYVPVTSGTVSFAAGESFKTIQITVLPNAALTTDRSFKVHLSSVPGGESQISATASDATVTIFKGTANDDDKIWLQSASYRFDASLVADSNGQVLGSYPKVTLVRKVAGTVATAKLLLVDNTAVFRTDYFTPLSGTRTLDVTFGLNSLTADLPIGALIGRGNKYMTIMLASASVGNSVGIPSTATVSFFDPSIAAGMIEFVPATYRVSGTSATITAVRSGTTGAVSVQWKASDGSAKSGTNYWITSGTTTNGGATGTVSFAAGEKVKTIPVRLMGSGTSEQSFSMLLTGTPTGGASIGANNSATVAIVNRPTAGIFSLDSSQYSFGAGSVQYVNVLRSGTGQPASVVIRLRDGTGRVGVDCGLVANSAISTEQTATGNFTADQTTIAVPIAALSGNGNKTMTIELADSSANSLIGTPRTAQVSFFENGVVSFSLATCHVSGTSDKAYLAVVRSGTTGQASVRYTAINGTAVSGTDFTLVSGTLTFSAGQQFKTIEVPLLATSATTNRTFTVQLSAPSAGTALGAISKTTVTKVAKPIDGGIAFSTDSYRFKAGKYENVTLVRSGTGQKVTAYVKLVDGTDVFGGVLGGVLGVDCVSQSTVTDRIVAVEFAANQSTASFTLGAYTGRGERSMILKLLDTSAGSATGMPGQATITFIDPESTNDVLEFSLSTHTVSGSNGVALATVSRSGTNTQPVTVKYATANGSAIAGTDYTVKSGTLSFAAGVTNQTIQVPILVRSSTASCTFSIQLSEPTGAASLGITDRTEVTIVRKAPNGVIRFGAAVYSFNGDGEEGVVDIVRSGTGQEASVYIEALDGTAKLSTRATLVGGTNVFLVSGTTDRAGVITFAPNEYKKQLAVSGTASGGNKAFKLRLVDTKPGASIGLPSETTIALIDKNNPNGVLEFSPTDYRVNAANGKALVVVTRGGSVGAVTAKYSTRNGTALSGTDYVLTSGTVSFASGETSKVIEVTILPTSGTVDRSFTVSLTGTATGGALIGAHNTATVVIARGTAAGSFQFSASSYRIDDATGGQVTVVRSGTGQAATVWVQAFDGTVAPASAQFSMVGAIGSQMPVTFAANESSKSISIRGAVSATKAFTLKLISASGGYGIGSLRQATVTLFDQGSANGLLEFSPTTYHVSGTAGLAYVSVIRTVTSGSTVSVVYNTVNGSAVAGTDFVATTGTLTFAPGVATKTFAISLRTTTATTDRAFTVTLSNPTGGAVIGAANLATVTVVKQTPGGLFRFGAGSFSVDAVVGGTVTILRSGTGQPATVYVQVADGTARLANGEYLVNGSTATNFAVNFAANESSKSIAVKGNVSASKNLILRLVDASAGSAVGTPNSTIVTLFNGTVGFDPATYYVSGTSAVLTVARSGTAGELWTAYSTLNGTATAGADYVAKSGTLKLLAGQKFRTFEVPITASGSTDRVFSVKLALATPNAGTVLGSASNAVVTIVRNAANGIFQFSAATYQVDDTRSGLITVNRNRTGTAATVYVEAQDGTATLASGAYSVDGLSAARIVTLNFAANEASKTIRVSGQVIGTKNFTLRLVRASAGSAIGAIDRATVNLLDVNAPAGLLEFSPTTYLLSGTNAMSAFVRVIRTGTTGAVSVKYAKGTDVPTTLNFGAGETVKTVEVAIPATSSTATRTFALQLSSPTGTVLGADCSAAITVIGKPANGLFTFKAAAYRIDESGGTVTIVRDQIGQAATVYVQAVDGTAFLTTGTLGIDKYSLKTASGASGSWLAVNFGANDLSASLSIAANVAAPRTFALKLVTASPGSAIGQRSTATVTLVPINIVEFSPTACRVSGTGALITVVRSGTAGDISVAYSATNGTAIRGTDYTLRNGSSVVLGSGTLSIPAGKMYGSIELQLSGTGTQERSFTLNLTGGISGGAVIGSGSNAAVTIVPVAPRGVFTFKLNGTGSSATPNVSMVDSAPGSVTVLRTGTGAATVTVEALDGTATLAAGTPGINEYAVTGTSGRLFTLSFATGETSKTIALSAQVNGTKDFKLRLVNASTGSAVGVTGEAVVTVTANGLVQFAPTAYSVSGANAVLTVVRTGTSGAASLPYTLKNGTALANTDYVATSGTVIFLAGKRYSFITVPLKTVATTGEKNFTVSLSNSSTTGGAFTGPDDTAAVTIVRSASAGTFSFSEAQSRVEDAGGYVTVTRSGTSAAATVYVQALDGTAHPGDYAVTGIQNGIVAVNFAANEASARIAVSGSVSEPKYFTMRLVNCAIGTIGTATVTMIDSAASKGFVEFGQTTCHVSGSATAVLTLVRSGTTTATSVAYSLIDGSARSGVDFALKSGTSVVTGGTVSFATGDTQKTIEIPLLVTSATTDRSFTVRLTGMATGGAAIGVDNQAVVTIVPRPTTGFYSFGQAGYRLNANLNWNYVMINRTVTTGSGEAIVAVVDGSGRYGETCVSGTLNPDRTAYVASGERTIKVRFGVGESSAVIPMAGFPDYGDTDVTLKLVDVPDGSAIGAPGATKLSFFDVNLINGLLEFSQTEYRVSESATAARVTVVRSGTAGQVTVGYRTSNGTALTGADYVATTGTLTFAPGVTSQTFDVRLVQNTQSATDAKTVNLTLENPSGYARIGVQNTATISIFDNDNPNGVFEIEQRPYAYNVNAGWAQVDISRKGGTQGAVDLLLNAQSNTAQLGVDYLLPYRNRSQIVLHFEPGQTRQTVAIPLALASGQLASENPRTFYPVLSTSGTGIVGVDNYAVVSLYSTSGLTQSAVELEESRYRFVEPATSSTTVQVKVVPYGPVISGTVTVPFSFLDGEAKVGVDYDYVDANRSVKLSGTNAVFIPVRLKHSSTAGTEKRFTVKLGTPSTGAVLLGQTMADVTIIDSEARAGIIAFDESSYRFDEDSGLATLTLVRTGSANLAASAIVESVNGSALEAISNDGINLASDSDFITNRVSVNFAAGQIEKRVSFSIFENPSLLDHTFLGQILWTGTNGAVGAQKFSTVTSANVSGLTKPALDFSAPFFDADENQGALVVHVRRIGTLSDAVTVDYKAVADTALSGSDYTVTPGTLSFAANEVSKDITVAINYNPLSQPDRKFFLELSNPKNITHPQTGAVLLASASVPVNILDVNRPAGGVIYFTKAAYSVTETQGKVSMTLTRAGNTSELVQLLIAVSGGTAIAGTDYAGAVGEFTMLQFAVGQSTMTIDFLVAKRTGTQGSRTVELGLYEPAVGFADARMGVQSSTTVTISD